MPPRLDRKRRTECLNIRFPLPNLLCAVYRVTLKKKEIVQALFVFIARVAVYSRDVVMIDSIRSGDGFGVSKRVDRSRPPADEGAAIYLESSVIRID